MCLLKLQPFLPSHITNIQFLLVSPLNFLQYTYICLKAQCSKLSTAQRRTSPAAAKLESFPPIFRGNHIVNLPDFNSLRRMTHSVCDSTYCLDSHVPYSCLAIYSLHPCLYNLFIFPTPVSLESGMFSLSLIFSLFFQEPFKYGESFSNCAHFQISKYTAGLVS